MNYVIKMMFVIFMIFFIIGCGGEGALKVKVLEAGVAIEDVDISVDGDYLGKSQKGFVKYILDEGEYNLEFKKYNKEYKYTRVYPIKKVLLKDKSEIEAILDINEISDNDVKINFASSRKKTISKYKIDGKWTNGRYLLYISEDGMWDIYIPSVWNREVNFDKFNFNKNSIIKDTGNDLQLKEYSRKINIEYPKVYQVDNKQCFDFKMISDGETLKFCK